MKHFNSHMNFIAAAHQFSQSFDSFSWDGMCAERIEGGRENNKS